MMMEAGAAAMRFEDRGRGHEPRNTGGHEEGKKSRKQILPACFQKEPALLTP